MCQQTDDKADAEIGMNLLITVLKKKSIHDVNGFT
jgi:hypothetical protein